MVIIHPVIGVVTSVLDNNTVEIYLQKFNDNVIADPIKKPRQPPVQVGEEVFVYYIIRRQRTHYAHPNFMPRY